MSIWNDLLASSCRKGNLDNVLSAISHGADDWNTGLENACSEGYYEIVLLMIEKGANNWNTGLIMASSKCYHRLVQLMINKGATQLDLALSYALVYRAFGSINSYNGAFHFQITSNIIMTILILIKHGASTTTMYKLSLSDYNIMWLVRAGVTTFPSYEYAAQRGQNTISKQKQLMNSYLIGDLTNVVSQY